MSVHIFFQGSIPFAVIGSNTITDVRGKQVRVRQYPWGMAEGLLTPIVFIILTGEHLMNLDNAN